MKKFNNSQVRDFILIIMLFIGMMFIIFGSKDRAIVMEEQEPTLAQQWHYQFENDSAEVNNIIERNQTNSLEAGYKRAMLREQGFIIVDTLYGPCPSKIADDDFYGIEQNLYNDKVCFITKK